MTRFHLEMSASTRARQLYPDTRCQPMRPRSAIHILLHGLVAWTRQEFSRIRHLWRLTDSEVLSLFRELAYPCNKVTDGRQASEVAIAADVLNRMLELGRPEYVRIA